MALGIYTGVSDSSNDRIMKYIEDPPSSLIGVYGRITGFSAPWGWYLVKMALAMCRPETMSSSGSLKRKSLVLWLTFCTSSSLRLTKPWSPPVKAFLTSAVADEAALAASLILASAFLAAGVPAKK